MSAFWSGALWVAFYVAIPGAAAIGAYAFIKGGAELLPARWLDATAERLNDACAIAMEWLTLPLRLVAKSKGTRGVRREKTPATDAAPWQAPIPGVASPAPGTTLAPAPWPAPEAVVREPVTRNDAAVLTPPPAAPPSTGAGQHETGQLLAIGYEPFHSGPRAIITDPRVNLRVTGAHAAIPDEAFDAPYRPYYARHLELLDQAAVTL